MEYALNKVYALNKQASKYMVMALFSSKMSIFLLVLTGYGFVLPYICFVHLALLDHSKLSRVLTIKNGMPRVLHGVEESHIG